MEKNMNIVKEKILKAGIVKEGNVLKVDSFLNHQMDIDLFNEEIWNSNRRISSIFRYGFSFGIFEDDSSGTYGD